MQHLFDVNFIVYLLNMLLLIITLGFAILVVILKNPIYIVLSLMFTFLTTAICWVTLNAEFLAFTLILLYVGAVTVVFLFVIMMLDLRSSDQMPNNHAVNVKNFFSNRIIKALSVILGLASIFVYISKDYNFLVTTNIANKNLQLLSQALFNDYILLFCMSGLLLLSAIISIVCLINTDQNTWKTQSIHQQTFANKKDRLKLLETI